MNRFIIFSSAILILCSLVAEEVTPLIEKKEVFLGEPIVLTIPLKPSGKMSASPKGDDTSFAVVGIEPAGEQVRIVLSALNIGTRKTPPILFRVNGTEYTVVSVEVIVKPNTTETDTHLRGIKLPLRAYEPDYLILWLIGSVLILTGLFFLFWRLSKRRRARELVTTVRKTPYQIALEYRRRAEQELQEMEYEEFTDTVTAGIRHYLELVKQRPFLEMTTNEVKKALKKTDLSHEESERIISLLTEADRFKYADERFSTEQFTRLLDEFCRIVDRIERQRAVSTLPEQKPLSR